jgi:hypothetical protein
MRLAPAPWIAGMCSSIGCHLHRHGPGAEIEHLAAGRAGVAHAQRDRGDLRRLARRRRASGWR